VGNVADSTKRRGEDQGTWTLLGHHCTWGSARPLPSLSYLSLRSWMGPSSRSLQGQLAAHAMVTGLGRGRAGAQAGFSVRKLMGRGLQHPWMGSRMGSHHTRKAVQKQPPLEPSPAPFDLQQKEGQDGNAAACKCCEIRLISNYREVSPCYLAGTFWPPWAVWLR